MVRFADSVDIGDGDGRILTEKLTMTKFESSNQIRNSNEETRNGEVSALSASSFEIRASFEDSSFVIRISPEGAYSLNLICTLSSTFMKLM